MRFLKDIYHSFLALAEKPYASFILGAVAFAESVIFPIPADVLLLSMSLGKPSHAIRFALVCSVFSVLGACAGFFLGKFLWELVSEWFLAFVFSEANFNAVGELFKANAFTTILTAAFTPVPFKVFTVAGGVFNVNFAALVAGSVIGRSARFFLLAGLVWKFGEDIKPFIDKHFNTLTIIFTLVVIAVLILFGR
ncbi:MAG: YqaA family protein [Thermodesulfobacteriota bacterium]